MIKSPCGRVITRIFHIFGIAELKKRNRLVYNEYSITNCKIKKKRILMKTFFPNQTNN